MWFDFQQMQPKEKIIDYEIPGKPGEVGYPTQ